MNQVTNILAEMHNNDKRLRLILINQRPFGEDRGYFIIIKEDILCGLLDYSVSPVPLDLGFAIWVLAFGIWDLGLRTWTWA